ncbi:MAG: class I SAM-dependent methyltransferase, partial [Lewinella sp.]|nr:class I SAM-dependent methyltransferase [Lewinella sp.]
AGLEGAYINASKTWLYPVINGIILLLPVYGIPLREGEQRPALSFDKERVFRYYNEVDYLAHGEQVIYADSARWVDYRPVARDYMHTAFLRAKKYLHEGGKYYLDIASGPIGLPEYLELSEGYEYRICIDISLRALAQAQHNYQGRGIYICGDITNIPLQAGICDAVLSQHTVYHIPRDDQRTAVEELYRVAKPGGTIGIVYSWFYHSPLMNITLLPVQLYRIARHFAGKLYVRLFNRTPRLYFYPHSPRWWRSFPFTDQMEMYCWRSVNKYFLDIYVHEKLGGRRLLRWISRLEERYPRFLGRWGDYPIIVIRKEG